MIGATKLRPIRSRSRSDGRERDEEEDSVFHEDVWSAGLRRKCRARLNVSRGPCLRKSLNALKVYPLATRYRKTLYPRRQLLVHGSSFGGKLAPLLATFMKRQVRSPEDITELKRFLEDKPNAPRKPSR